MQYGFGFVLAWQTRMGLTRARRSMTGQNKTKTVAESHSNFVEKIENSLKNKRLFDNIRMLNSLGN
jgi:hypothetical protein